MQVIMNVTADLIGCDINLISKDALLTAGLVCECLTVYCIICTYCAVNRYPFCLMDTVCSNKEPC